MLDNLTKIRSRNPRIGDYLDCRALFLELREFLFDHKGEILEFLFVGVVDGLLSPSSQISKYKPWNLSHAQPLSLVKFRIENRFSQQKAETRFGLSSTHARADFGSGSGSSHEL